MVLLSQEEMPPKQKVALTPGKGERESNGAESVTLKEIATLRSYLSPELDQRMRKELSPQRQQLVMQTVHHRVRVIQATVGAQDAKAAAPPPAATVSNVDGDEVKGLVRSLTKGIAQTITRQAELQLAFKRSTQDDRDARIVALVITAVIAIGAVLASFWLAEGHNLYKLMRFCQGAYRWFMPTSQRTWTEDTGQQRADEYQMYI